MGKNLFGKNLKEVREFLGLSQQRLSFRAGITIPAISQIESGKREPSLKTIIKLLDALNVTFERMVKP